MDHSSSISTNITHVSTHSSSAFSSPLPSRQSHPKKTKSSQKKISNTGALLDQYQDDDDLTTNLLHAIRSWNLERPPAPAPVPAALPYSTSSLSTIHSTAEDDGALFANTNTAGTPTSTSTPFHPSPNQDQHQQHHDCSSTINTIQSSSSSTIASNSKWMIDSSACTTTTTTPIHTNNSMSSTNHHNSNHSSSNSNIYYNGSGSCCNGSTRSTITNDGSCNSNSNSITSSVKKSQTPKGNYSSRPSGLTARILLECEDELLGQQHQQQQQHHHQQQQQQQEEDQHQQEQQEEQQYFRMEEKEKDDYIQQEKKEENTKGEIEHDPTSLSFLETNTNLNMNTNVNDRENHHTTPIKSNRHSATSITNNTTSNIDPTAILQEIASTLGLDPDHDFQKLVPTIKKLVRVVMVHVPNLEQFVEEVCNVVIVNTNASAEEGRNTTDDYESGLESESGMETDDYYDCAEGKSDEHEENKMKRRRRRRSSSRQQRRSSKQPKKKSLQARKKKMDDAVRILKQEWHSKVVIDSSANCSFSPLSSSTTKLITPHRSRGVLQKVNTNNIDSRERDDNNNDQIKRAKNDLLRNKVETNLNAKQKHCAQVINQEASFRNAVMEKLKKGCHFDHGQVKDSSLDDNEQALATIDNLINFEEKYSKVHGLGNEDQSNASVIQSPPKSDSILRELFDADPTTLRQFVLHFAYLFSVRQDEIMTKMNDIYVFSHEASVMIKNVKQILGLATNCPIHLVAKRVAEIVKTMDESITKSSSLIQNHQQRNQHVRFNAVVEEFS